MKSFILFVTFFLFLSRPTFVHGQTGANPSPSPAVLGLYDAEAESTNSATATASATTYLDPTNAPVSGNLETSLIIFFAGISFILLGINFSKKSI